MAAATSRRATVRVRVGSGRQGFERRSGYVSSGGWRGRLGRPLGRTSSPHRHRPQVRFDFRMRTARRSKARPAPRTWRSALLFAQSSRRAWDAAPASGPRRARASTKATPASPKGSSTRPRFCARRGPAFRRPDPRRAPGDNEGSRRYGRACWRKGRSSDVSAISTARTLRSALAHVGALAPRRRLPVAVRRPATSLTPTRPAGAEQRGEPDQQPR